MSTSLSFELEPVPQRAARVLAKLTPDPVERETWGRLRIRVAGRTVTDFWDPKLREERSHINVPAFSIAQWIVSNWWTLLYEPCRTDSVPTHPSAVLSRLPWVKRHCLRSADSSLFLPALYVFSDGRGSRVEWQDDKDGTLPHMPGEFTGHGSEWVPTQVAQDALGEFVRKVLGRVAGLEDERVQALRSDWQAIENADEDEAEFCAAAGRIGIDPYDPDEMTDELAAFIEGIDPEQPLARDLMEVAEPTSITAQWSWVKEATDTLKIGPMANLFQASARKADTLPYKYAYELAGEIRARAGIGESQPVDEISTVARRVAGVPCLLRERNHLAAPGVRAVVGRSHTGEIVVAGPHRLPESERFHTARALYEALFACEASARLITNAFTWDQQASRAFAAELLAPQAALAQRVPESADKTTVEDLAAEYRVSTAVVSLQLKNAGVPLLLE